MGFHLFTRSKEPRYARQDPQDVPTFVQPAPYETQLQPQPQYQASPGGMPTLMPMAPAGYVATAAYYPSAPAAAAPPPPPPQVALDPKKKMRLFISEIEGIKREIAREDAELKYELDRLAANDRLEEAESIIEQLTGSAVYQQEIDQIVFKVKMAGRNTRLADLNRKIFSAMGEIIQVPEDEEEQDVNELITKVVEQQTTTKEGLTRLSHLVRQIQDPTGSVTSAARNRIKDDIMKEMQQRTGVTLPALQKQQQPNLQNSDVLKRLNQAQ